jgi:CRP-like cAMP-binding protein
VAPRIDVAPGPWLPEPPPGGGAPVLVLDGLLCRDAALADRTSTQLLGPGDIVDPWLKSDELLPCRVSWRAHTPAVLGLLDGRFGQAARRWPSLSAVVTRRLCERADRLAAQGAALQLSNVEQRLVANLWQLADRFGRVAPGGVVIPLQLTHQLLGQLVGAQRPTVTLAATKLTESGYVTRREDGTWFLSDGSREVLTPPRPAI